MPTQSIRLTQDQVQGLVWEPYEVTEDYRRSRAVYGIDPQGNPVYAVKTEVFAPDQFLDANVSERNDNEGQRWGVGMGSDKGGNMPLVKVASIPMNVWARDLASRAKDPDHKKWWLNRSENEPFRVRKGKL